MTNTENNEYPFAGRISDAEWDNRRLCPDGNCIGVIGPDGRCKECGRPAGEDLPPIEEAVVHAPSVSVEETNALPTDVPPADNHREEAEADGWEDRRLCPDGNCIGVIGPDGRCKECGRPAEDR